MKKVLGLTSRAAQVTTGGARRKSMQRKEYGGSKYKVSGWGKKI